MVLLTLEVMDKEPRLRVVWWVCLIIAYAGYRMVRVRTWLAVPALIIWGFAAWVALGDLFDPMVRPAILAEAGVGYVIQLIAAISLALGVILFGLVRRVQSNKRLKLTAPF